ncbi:mannose-6-phosphate isomerase, class I [Atopococcus tabaci]|uniref:mannose-6-phosphate isomerase, class I n=1 Tax=Atopococcus tabaci TaxID=269774 RepID=UPI0004232F00|nr:mannose-6-phosphate isomerase, class I [Atopococcus tabaci]
MSEPLFLQGVLQEKIWGGTKLRDVFGYDLDNDQTGELWAISAHPNGPAVVKNGTYAGRRLDELWSEHRELFGQASGDVFPLLTKIIDAAQDLSVQVHPDDDYGLRNEGELGKTECWYIIDAEEDAEIVYGHHAKTRQELEEMIASGDWDHLLRRVKVKKGDFFYVPSGTIHAIGGGIMILETQQSSDTTYRVYDYDRKGTDGNPRPLHTKQSIEVTTVPHTDPEPAIHVEKQGDATVTTLVDNSFFRVQEWLVDGKAQWVADAPYTLISVLDGGGTLFADKHTYPLKKGDHLVMPNDIDNWILDGELHIISSTPGKE